MAMRFTATVKNREVIVRDVPMHDGEIVEVTIVKPASGYEWTEEELREIELGEADIAAGRVMSIDEALASLKRSAELRRQRRAAGDSGSRSRGRKVGSPRTRAKPATRRAPRRK
ncbi:MAG TPA: hypothetical protein VIV11_32985 [Kofleriaceae bacterium]